MENRARTNRTNGNRAYTRTLTFIIIVILMMGLSLLFLRYSAARIQSSNNNLARENEYLQAEIDSLNSQIVEEVKLTKIEKVAVKDYGMIYPTSDNIVYMDEESDEGRNLASIIKNEAYN